MLKNLCTINNHFKKLSGSHVNLRFSVILNTITNSERLPKTNNNLMRLFSTTVRNLSNSTTSKSIRYKLIFQYKGTNFEGYQKQNNKGQARGNTVQRNIEEALHKFFNTNSIYVVGSSRTDAGVHALHNTCHFDVDREIIERRKNHSLKSIVFGVNSYLRDLDIVICACEQKDNTFHCRHNVKEREYQYRVLLVGPKPDIAYRVPFIQDQFYLVNGVPISVGEIPDFSGTPMSLDTHFNIEAVREACSYFVGTHNFNNFCRSDLPERISRMKTVHLVEVQEHSIGQDQTLSPLHFSAAKCREIRFVIRGKSFLHNQVRIMVDALIKVGLNKISPYRIRSALENPYIKFPEKGCVPPHGLYLTNVVYNTPENNPSEEHSDHEDDEEGSE